jgi:hypothetical protein
LEHIEQVITLLDLAEWVVDVPQNLIDFEKGPLREPGLKSVFRSHIPPADEVLKVLDEAWISVKPFSTKYHK